MTAAVQDVFKGEYDGSWMTVQLELLGTFSGPFVLFSKTQAFGYWALHKLRLFPQENTETSLVVYCSLMLTTGA